MNCTCSKEIKIGQTSVMCCNICGLPDQDFWKPNELDLEALKYRWDKLSDQEKKILGLPNFSCAGTAAVLREAGFSCAYKAEMEQALVIFICLQAYNIHGDGWGAKLSSFIVSKKPIT